MKYSILHIPTFELVECSSQEQASKAIINHERSSDEFMMLRETLRDKIIMRLVEIKNESKTETKFSKFFLTVIDSTYNHFTSKQVQTDPLVMRSTLTGISKELHSLNLVYTSELKYEKLNIEEIAVNIDNWIEAMDEVESTHAMKAWIAYVQNDFKEPIVQEIKAICEEMLKTKEFTTHEPTIMLMTRYNEIVWSKNKISYRVSEELELVHEKTNITEHVYKWLNKMLTV